MADLLRFFVDSLRTPLGELRIVSDDHARLRAVDWRDFEPRLLRTLAGHYGPSGWRLTRASDPFGHTSALAAYFTGDITAIDALQVETGGTPFQRAVWHALREIAAGTTLSYGELARKIGRPSAVRAVGLANRANPIGIVVPCHRVIGADGSLTGYGGGLERKRWLLRHESLSAGAHTRELPLGLH